MPGRCGSAAAAGLPESARAARRSVAGRARGRPAHRTHPRAHRGAGRALQGRSSGAAGMITDVSNPTFPRDSRARAAAARAAASPRSTPRAKRRGFGDPPQPRRSQFRQAPPRSRPRVPVSSRPWTGTYLGPFIDFLLNAFIASRRRATSPLAPGRYGGALRARDVRHPRSTPPDGRR